MRFNLKIIAFVVLVSLIGVIIYQAFWLKNFYDAQYSKLETSVVSAMSMANLDELGMRIGDIQLDALSKIKGLRKEIRNGQTIYVLEKEDKRGNAFLDSLPGSKQVDEDSILILNPPDVVVRIKNENGKANMWNDASAMSLSVQQGFHRVLDSVRPVNLFRFDSLLQVSFSRMDIRIPYYLEYVDCSGNHVIENIRSQTPDTPTSSYRLFTFSTDENDLLEYRLYLYQPAFAVFKSMGGLVIASILMVFLLLISYLILLRIILRQKSVDEIKSDFTNNMTHELKTPISVAYAAIDALQNFGIAEDVQKREEYLSISKEQLTNLNGLVEQILTMSVEERKNIKIMPSDVSLKELFCSVKDKFSVNPSKPVEFHLSIIPESLTVKADRIHFVNLMNNLVENAIKYSYEKVHIDLSAYMVGSKCVISVGDNGIGINASATLRIFDKFYRVPTGNIHNVKGYGLGLSYVKTIVDRHGWQIDVESTPGKGSLFKIITA